MPLYLVSPAGAPQVPAVFMCEWSSGKSADHRASKALVFESGWRPAGFEFLSLGA